MTDETIVFILLAGAICCAVGAQEINTEMSLPDSAAVVPVAPVSEIIGGSEGATDMYVYDGYHGEPLPQTDSLHLPAFDSLGRMYVNMYPLDWCGAYNWDLHKGLNVNLGASVLPRSAKAHGVVRGLGRTSPQCMPYR